MITGAPGPRQGWAAPGTATGTGMSAGTGVAAGVGTDTGTGTGTGTGVGDTGTGTGRWGARLAPVPPPPPPVPAPGPPARFLLLSACLACWRRAQQGPPLNVQLTGWVVVPVAVNCSVMRPPAGMLSA